MTYQRRKPRQRTALLNSSAITTTLFMSKLTSAEHFNSIIVYILQIILLFIQVGKTDRRIPGASGNGYLLNFYLSVLR